MPNLFEGQLCFGEGSTPCQPPTSLRRRVSRGGVVPGLALEFLWATTPLSPALDHPCSLLGKAASAEEPDVAARRCGNGEIPFLWSEHRPAEDKTFERPAELRGCHDYIICAGSFNERAIGRYCDQRICRSEPSSQKGGQQDRGPASCSADKFLCKGSLSLIRLPAAESEDISLCRPSKAFRRGCFPA